MPSGREMQLWWSGEAESMFVYYLTGALGIALIASITLTRSLRRKEPLVTELLHEDNVRDELLTYLLKIVTSPLSGCGCPASAKVFMQLTGDRKMSQYFQIRSHTGGKAMLQRGFTDIFMFKVPESVGEIMSVKFLIAGLDGQLKWEIEEAHLYSPSARERKSVPVVVTLLEVLDCSKSILVHHRFFNLWIKSQLLYHQWLAMYGNTVRVGAFTEIMHVMSVFVSIFTLLILSQMCYIYLPRPDVTLTPTVAPTSDNEEEKDNSGTFHIDLMSLLIATVFSTVCCCFFTLALEILARSVNSLEKNPGNAYYSICENEIKKVFGKRTVCFDDEQHKTYFTLPLYLRFRNTDFFRDEILRNIESPMTDRKHTEEIALYIKRLLYSLKIEHKKYFKTLDVLKKGRKRENLQQEPDRVKKFKADEDALTTPFPKFRDTSESDQMHEMWSTEKVKFQKKMDKLNEIKPKKDITIAFPRFSYVWLSGSYDSEYSRSPQSLGSCQSSLSLIDTKLHETYLDVLKRKVLSRKNWRNVSFNAVTERGSPSRKEFSNQVRSKAADRVENKCQVYSQQEERSNRNYSSTITANGLKSSVEYFKNTTMQENSEFETGDRRYDIAMGEIDYTMEALDRNVNANKNNVGSTTIKEENNLNSSVRETDHEKFGICSLDVANDDLTNVTNDVEELSTALVEKSQSLENFKKTLKWMKESQENFRKAWHFDQKTWCRRAVKEICDVIRCTREMLLKDQINFYVLKEKLLQTSNTIVQLFMVACSVSCTTDQFRELNSTELVSLLWHMAMEILAYALQEISQVFEQRDNATLADLVLQSHAMMLAINHAVYPVIYIIKHGTDKIYLLNHIPLNKDMDRIIVVLLKCCFQLVVKYNLVFWEKLHFLVEIGLKECLDGDCYSHLIDFVEENIIDQTAENTALKKLCNLVEESSKKEAWEEVHEEKLFFTTILIKIQLLKALKNKITRITKKKYAFDETHDLLPKEPKSRLQLLVERRRKPADAGVRHIKWNKDEQDGKNREESKEELKEHSKQLGYYVDNLTVIYDKLKRLMERQGLSLSIKASEFLAQAVLHPHVIVLPGKVNEPGMYTFDNYLQLKRIDMLIALFYEATGKELVTFLLTTAVKDNRLSTEKLEHPDIVLNNIIIKIDTLAQLLCNDIENVMHKCVRIEQYEQYETGHSKHSQIGMAVTASVNSLLQTPVLKQWSSLDLKSGIPSEMLEPSRMQEDTGYRNRELFMPYHNSTTLDHNNSNPYTVNMEEISLEVDTRNVKLTDILEDLRPLKGYMDYVKHGEMMRSMMTQMGYIERAKNKRDYVRTVQINNIIDSYFMIDEGDDSKTLTKSGLYQLEYDCTGEDRKPLGSWLKVILVTLMLVLQIFIVVYITMIGGQFSTTELQEWMCYFLLAVGVFGLVFEPVRAFIVALYVRKLQKKLWP